MATLTHPCPLCGAPAPHTDRYPRAVCHDCESRTTDSRGRRVVGWNVSMSGGFEARYVAADGRPGEVCDEVTTTGRCLVDGIECTIGEARFGGVVVQTLPAERPFRVGFVTGATPDKWAGIWRRRRPRDPLELVPVEQATQEQGLRNRDLDMGLVRLPIDRQGLHCIPLYDEVPVVVVGVEHVVSAVDEVTLDNLTGEQLLLPHESGWTPTAEQLDWPVLTVREAIEVAATGTGMVIVPMSVARLHHRRDVTFRPVTDLSPTTVGLAWLVENDDARIQAFIGIVRGRTERSSRS